MHCGTCSAVVITSADSQPTKLRGAVFLLGFFLRGRGGTTSLEGGNRASCCRIITVISFWIWGVPGANAKHTFTGHSIGRCFHPKVTREGAYRKLSYSTEVQGFNRISVVGAKE